MKGKVIKLPLTHNKETDDGHVPCLVSDRWLRFPPASTYVDNGEYMFVDVMTQDRNGNERKLCSVCVSREDILKALNSVKPEM